MYRICTLSLFLALRTVWSYNVEPTPSKTFTVSSASFGYRVIQTNAQKLLVSAPLVTYQQDKRGKIYSCTIADSSCSEINIQVPTHGKMMSLGLSMFYNQQSAKALVCGPTIPKTCETITMYNGMCFQLNERLTPVYPGHSPNVQECPGGTDIVFVMDGSGSVSNGDFQRMKTFITNLIQQFISGNIQFAVMQYSDMFEIHLDFNEFKNQRNWDTIINNIRQQKGTTHTPTAIIRSVRELFVSSSGARPNANRVLVVITDGVTYGDNTPMKDAVAVAESYNVIRYAIGVGSAFTYHNAIQELETIASKPTANHLFRVNNFQALNNIKDTLRKSIFAIEGSQTSGKTLQMELAQEGFSSALLSSGEVLMGTVGANDWMGGYQQITSKNSFFRNVTGIETNSYLGYSMAVAKQRQKNIVILGAPRYQHEGIVIIHFDTDATKTIRSKQIGSYFGAEVCTVDLDSDSNTDLLLISAPSYTNPTRDSEGEVTVCSFLRKESIDQSCNSVTLVGDAGMRGRFGASISALADLNGDKISEVAVGAPMENNGKGSVYIFCGVTGGINPAYCQKIMGSSTDPGLQYFGQSISGSLDQTGDGLPDIAVGSNGKVLLFRSRPVLFVRVTVSYNPTKIPTNNRDCSVERSHNANICFHATRRTRDTGGFTAQINYTLTLDSTRSATRTRAYFSDKSQSHTNTVTIDTNVICVQQQFLIPSCPEDALNPLHNGLRFSFDGLSSDRSRLAPVLDPSSQENTNHPLDFEMNCGADSKCIDDLRVDFNFSGVSEVQVGIALELNVTISVENRGEDSYNSHVIFTYPAGLSYRRVTLLQRSNSRNTVQCTALESSDSATSGSSNCFINRPIFESKGQVFFMMSLGINGNTQFNRTVTIMANVTSGNEEHQFVENTRTKSLPVKYSINFVLRSFVGSTNFINFTAGKSSTKPVLHSFEVLNFLRNFNATLTIKVPIRFGDKEIWANDTSIEIPGCQKAKDEFPVGKNVEEKLKTSPHVDCGVSLCRVIKCTVELRRGITYLYNISGEVRSEWIEETKLPGVQLISSAVAEYDESQFIFFSASQSTTRAETSTQVEMITEPNFTKEIVGGVVGGLLLLVLVAVGLYKAGFFKSKYNQMVKNAEGEGAADGSPDAPLD